MLTIKIKCPCETNARACCACVSMHCDECHDYSKFKQGEFCSHCGRPLKAELQRNYIPRAEVEHLQVEKELVQKSHDSFRELYNTDTKALSDTIERLIEELETAKTEVAREIFEEIFTKCVDYNGYIEQPKLAELKKKYTGGWDD